MPYECQLGIVQLNLLIKTVPHDSRLRIAANFGLKSFNWMNKITRKGRKGTLFMTFDAAHFMFKDQENSGGGATLFDM